MKQPMFHHVSTDLGLHLPLPRLSPRLGSVTSPGLAADDLRGVALQLRAIQPLRSTAGVFGGVTNGWMAEMKGQKLIFKLQSSKPCLIFFLLWFRKFCHNFEKHVFMLKRNYTGIECKQQQTMFPRRSCAIKNSLVAPFLRKETKKKGDKARNPSPEPEGTRKSWWNTILFLRKEKKTGRQAPEP